MLIELKSIQQACEIPYAKSIIKFTLFNPEVTQAVSLNMFNIKVALSGLERSSDIYLHL